MGNDVLNWANCLKFAYSNWLQSFNIYNLYLKQWQIKYTTGHVTSVVSDVWQGDARGGESDDAYSFHGAAVNDHQFHVEVVPPGINTDSVNLAWKTVPRTTVP